MNKKKFGEVLKELRIDKNMTLSKLAKLSDVSSPYLSQLETNKRNPPKPEILKKIANGLTLGGVDGALIYRKLSIAANYLEDTVSSNKQVTIDIKEYDRLKGIEEKYRKIVDVTGI